MSHSPSRKKIGLQLQQIGTGYSAKIWPGIVDCAESRNVDLIMFPGQSLENPYGFNYQYNLIYQQMNEKNLDALILYTSLIGNFVDLQVVQQFCHSIKGIPVISVGAEIPGIPSIIIDNKSGIKEMVQHLVHEHKARRIAFFKGPESNWEAEERFVAFQEEMAAQNLPVEENLIARGDFTLHTTPAAMDELLAKCGELPDAIIFANDEMALRSLDYLEEKGFSVPKQIAVTGFDDIDQCRFTTPQLTSIRQPLYEMAWKAVETALDMLDGKPVENVISLPTKVVVRTSCGCPLEIISEMYRTIEKVRDTPSFDNEADSMYNYIASHLSPKCLNERENIIGTMIHKLLSLPDLLPSENELQYRRFEFTELFQKTLEKEIRLKMVIKDWLLILTAISQSLYTVKMSLKKEREIQLNLRLCSLVTSELSEILQNTQNNNINNVQKTLREVLGSLSSIVQMDQLIEDLHSQLPLLDVKTFYLYAYKKPWEHERGAKWKTPESIEFINGMVDQNPVPFGLKDTTFPTLGLFTEALMTYPIGRTLLIYPLFFREVHYGLIIFELSKDTVFVIESLVTTISSVIKGISLYNSKERIEEKLRNALMELEENNEVLNNLSITDELTGLYNRRGFMKLALQQHRLNIQMKKKSLMIFLDVDGLKIVNDVHGHDEGDWIIQMTGEVIKKTFRNMDILARFGGDEFCVFTPNAGKEVFEVFKKRLSSHVIDLNKNSGKPFNLSISIGAVECNYEDEHSLEDFMKQADEELYKEKRRKKEARLK
ncbi:MAG TPA: GGDEF domain-containing protein [Treponemataceae bacterium]|nr:GGDEF domain-containing protein [Treponemataceae bacterium]